jgi:hypothetical protein
LEKNISILAKVTQVSDVAHGPLVYEKKICCRFYGDHGDWTAIMLQLHGVYTATACNLWAFVPRSK